MQPSNTSVSVMPAPAAAHDKTQAVLRRLRILFCTFTYFPTPGGGTGSRARVQAEELVRRGHHLTAVCPRWPGTRSETVNGVEVHRLPMLDCPGLRRISFLPGLFIWLLPHMRGFDITQVFFGDARADLAIALGMLTRRPVYVALSGAGPQGELRLLRGVDHLTRHFALRRARRVQTLSKEMTKDAVAFGIEPSRVVQIPNGVDPVTFQPAVPCEKQELRRRLGLPQDAVIALFVGRFSILKGMPELLEAWQVLASPGRLLVLVGSSDTTDSVGELTEAPSVVVRGWTNRIADYYRAADIFVLPSHTEGMSNAVLEAMASGLAVVATRVGGIETAIQDGVNGLLIAPQQWEPLRDALQRLLDDPDLRGGLGACARQTIVTRFSVARVVDRIEQVYAEMLAE